MKSSFGILDTLSQAERDRIMALSKRDRDAEIKSIERARVKQERERKLRNRQWGFIK